MLESNDINLYSLYMISEGIQIKEIHLILQEGDLDLINSSGRFAQELLKAGINIYGVLREYKHAANPDKTLYGRLGFKTDPGVLSSTLAGRKSGARTAERLLCSLSLLGIIQLPYKRLLLNEIVNQGQTSDPSLISSTGFSKSIAETLDIPEQILRQIIRTLRIEIILQFNDGLVNEASKEQFFIYMKKHVEDYYYKRFPSLQSPFYTNKDLRQAIEEAIDNRNITQFYKLIYSTSPAGPSLGTLLPYEIEFFRTYNGDLTTFQPRSRLENLLLQYRLEERTLDDLARNLTSQTGLPLDETVLDYYIEMMLLPLNLIGKTRSSIEEA